MSATASSAPRRILAVIGSPRKRGNTYSVVRRVEETMRGTGAVEFTYLFLADVDLQSCVGCWKCLGDGEQLCPRKDDRDAILRSMEEADGLVLAAPVYALGMPALMKNFYDRLAFTAHRPRFFDKPALLVSTTGALGTGRVLRQLAFFRHAGLGPFVKLGLSASESTVEEKLKRAMERKVHRAARRFAARLSEKTPRPAGFVRAVTFHVQRACFRLYPSFPAQAGKADYEWFRDHGWLDPTTKYFTKGRVFPLTHLFGLWQGWLVGRMARRGFEGVPWKEGAPKQDRRAG